MNTPELDKIRMNQEFTAFLEPFFSNENNLNRWIPILEFKNHTKLTLSEIHLSVADFIENKKLEYVSENFRYKIPSESARVMVTHFLVWDFDLANSVTNV